MCIVECYVWRKIPSSLRLDIWECVCKQDFGAHHMIRKWLPPAPTVISACQHQPLGCCLIVRDITHYQNIMSFSHIHINAYTHTYTCFMVLMLLYCAALMSVSCAVPFIFHTSIAALDLNIFTPGSSISTNHFITANSVFTHSHSACEPVAINASPALSCRSRGESQKFPSCSHTWNTVAKITAQHN